ncbi:MAG: RNA polymerase sigma factor [Brevinemataceae bacterium]
MTFEEFYEHNKTLVYRMCRAKTSKDLAEESTAKAFVEVWKRWETVSQMDYPTAYTITIARNIAYKEFLKSKAKKFFGLETIEEYSDMEQTPEKSIIHMETKDHIWENIRKLSNREQEILILKDIEERSFQECADILNLSLNAAKSLRHRAKNRLAKLLKESLGEHYGQ